MHRLFGKRKWADLRNAFWDSAKPTVILIRVATGQHLNARANMYGISMRYYTRNFCNTHLAGSVNTSRIGKSSSKGDVRRCSRSTNIHRVVTNVVSCKWSRLARLQSQMTIRQKFAGTHVQNAFTFVECLTKESVSEAVSMQATHNQSTDVTFSTHCRGRQSRRRRR